MLTTVEAVNRQRASRILECAAIFAQGCDLRPGLRQRRASGRRDSWHVDGPAGLPRVRRGVRAGDPDVGDRAMTAPVVLTAAQARELRIIARGRSRPDAVQHRKIRRLALFMYGVASLHHSRPYWRVTDAGRAWLAANPDDRGRDAR